MKAQTRLSAVKFAILSTIKQALVSDWAVSQWVAEYTPGPPSFTGDWKWPTHTKKKEKEKRI